MRGCLVGCGCLGLAVTVVLGLLVVGAVAIYYFFFRRARNLPSPVVPNGLRCKPSWAARCVLPGLRDWSSRVAAPAVFGA